MPRRSRSSPGGGPSGSAVNVTSTDFYKLTNDLKAVDRKLAAEMKRQIRQVGEPLRQAVAREASWSRRIPGATKVSTRFTAKTQRVILTVNRRQAPHARPLENGDRAGTFTHPYFGKGEVRQQSRPFFARAIRGQYRNIDAAFEQVAKDFERKLGFK